MNSCAGARIVLALETPEAASAVFATALAMNITEAHERVELVGMTAARRAVEALAVNVGQAGGKARAG